MPMRPLVTSASPVSPASARAISPLTVALIATPPTLRPARPLRPRGAGWGAPPAHAAGDLAVVARGYLERRDAGAEPRVQAFVVVPLADVLDHVAFCAQ